MMDASELAQWPDVVAEIKASNLIGAVAALRGHVPVSLSEAKRLIEEFAMTGGDASTPDVAGESSLDLAQYPEVLEALDRGNLVEAISALRRRTGLSLLAAKQALEHWRLPDPPREAAAPEAVYGELLRLTGRLSGMPGLAGDGFASPAGPGAERTARAMLDAAYELCDASRDGRLAETEVRPRLAAGWPGLPDDAYTIALESAWRATL
jgi:ribosomal protein L7/L12